MQTTLTKKPYPAKEKQLGVRMSPEMKQKFEYEAAELGLKASALARQLIVDYLEGKAA